MTGRQETKPKELLDVRKGKEVTELKEEALVRITWRTRF
jgi:hypothetical protein